ncbi:hypothetical protein GE061_010655 [Apolygus lucorum]|uniref:Uncharacterized protein n=1 Tax=Apolygus lucorum TaxID=248454 RepID=A0A8S9XV57_APOLU|nr:hypothetical protein GE061_010655 [Apolygus lucorum]
MSKSKMAMGCTREIFWRGRVVSWDAKTKLFETMVESVLLYAAEVWGIWCGEEVEVVQSAFLKSQLCLPRNTPGHYLGLECGLRTCDSAFNPLYRRIVEFGGRQHYLGIHRNIHVERLLAQMRLASRDITRFYHKRVAYTIDGTMTYDVTHDFTAETDGNEPRPIDGPVVRRRRHDEVAVERVDGAGGRRRVDAGLAPGPPPPPGSVLKRPPAPRQISQSPTSLPHGNPLSLPGIEFENLLFIT